MIISTRFLTVVMAAVGFVGLGLGTGTASAESANGDMVPLGSTLRSCDFSKLGYVGTIATGSGHGDDRHRRLEHRDRRCLPR